MFNSISKKTWIVIATATSVVAVSVISAIAFPGAIVNGLNRVGAGFMAAGTWFKNLFNSGAAEATAADMGGDRGPGTGMQDPLVTT